MEQKKSNTLKIIVGFAIVLAISLFSGYQYVKQNEISSINSFEECAKKFPVMESYPPRCQVPNGKSFTLNIGNELEYRDEFLLSNPRPNQKIISPLVVKGKAKGMWYFEGSFSGELFDQNGKLLGVVIITAQGEWMTEEFVPFEGKLQFDEPETATGKLIIKNANPSGMEENEKSVIIPVKF